MTVTLEKIQAKQAESALALTELSKMIEQFKTNPPSVLVLPQTSIQLHPGERYAGVILDVEGKPNYHLILLPGKTKATWQNAVAWAKEAGGELPKRREQSLLFANLKDAFEGVWHWSGEEHSDSYAWIQSFSNGTQDYRSKSSEFAAVAVRRSVL